MTDSDNQQDLVYPEIQQDHKKGPGWFLILTYIIVTLFCIYYFVTYKDWKSNYEEQQDQLRTKITETQPEQAAD